MKLIAMFSVYFYVDRLCVSVDVDVTSIAFVFYESEVLLPHHGSVLFARGWDLILLPILLESTLICI